MNYFRNPEIKKEWLLYVLIFIAATGVGGFIFSRYVSLYVGVVGVFFLVIHLIVSFRRYRRIAALAEQIDPIIHSENALFFKNQEEGELSLLESQIQKMFHKMKQQTEYLKKDKRYLADSIADISHQIRTPLTAMNLIVTRLEKLAQEEEWEIRETGTVLLRDLESMLRHMDWLIETLLKLARLDAGTIVLKQEKVSVVHLCRCASEPLAISMELRGQNLVIDCDEECTFEGDLAWMTEALTNILKNGMEHTSCGGTIHILASENALYTEILVEDNGAGFAVEDLPHLFERFYRGKTAKREPFDSQHAPESIGIGLALAKSVIQQQNGTVTAENRQEGGARFCIRFYKSII